MRLVRRLAPTATAPAAAKASPAMFVVVQARQALQQTAAIGACSPYLLTTGSMRVVARSSMLRV